MEKCRKCGQDLHKYSEGWVDDLTRSTSCPKGGVHEPERQGWAGTTAEMNARERAKESEVPWTHRQIRRHNRAASTGPESESSA